MTRYRQTIQLRYGVDHPMHTQTFKDKQAATNIERYGVTTPLASTACREAGRQRMIECFGVEHPMQLADVRERQSRTVHERYGVDNIFKHDGMKEKLRAIWLKRYSVDNPMKAAEIQAKARATCLKNHGVAYPMQSATVKAKFDWSARARSIHQTMKSNGTYARQASSVEDGCHRTLCDIFGDDDVERHVEVNCWCIDFHILSLNLYIQFDGVYWHGLDRSIEAIKEFKSPRDATIYNTWLRDRKQDEWFEENNIPLLRVTDRDNLYDVFKELLELLIDDA